MDDYSKSGPKSPKAASNERDRDNRVLVRRLLDIEDEKEFIEELRNRKMTPNLAAYKNAINAWREKHRGR